MSAKLTELLQAGYRYGLALTQDHHNSEDLLQQAVYRLTSKYGKVKNRAILYQTMRNLHIDQQRRRKVVQFEILEDTHSSNTLSETQERVIWMQCFACSKLMNEKLYF